VENFKLYTAPDNRPMNPRMLALLREWHKTLCAYETEWSKVWEERGWGRSDLPYIWNQEALVGILAFAAVKLDAYPFIEFGQDKSTPTRRGRQDLNIMYSSGRDWDSWTIEASLVRIEPLTQEPGKLVEEKVRLAKEDALRQLEGNENREYDTGSIAIVFVTFTERPEDSGRETAENLFSHLTRRTKPDFAALHLCRPDILKKSDTPGQPGQAILGWYHDRKRL